MRCATIETLSRGPMPHTQLLRCDLSRLPQNLVDRIDKKILAVGLRYVAVGANVQAASNVLIAGQSRKHDHRQQ
jgi:hypothetical protein